MPCGSGHESGMELIKLLTRKASWSSLLILSSRFQTEMSTGLGLLPLMWNSFAAQLVAGLVAMLIARIPECIP